ncbi:hypothetical protein ACQX0N_00775 [Clostridium tepidum]|jgi:hypothetical protein|uniref:Uncharacterized protein n=1 Tax=Clostridium tepidum TaxID=1962263 RepID=A0A1S9IAA4_9CLOT|nr:hypothetical protein [Clostridium tepidum]MCR1934748.1 hypothetical protein [Clostridium tepidum]MDU6878293.1 hypothetical protein [Clostridium botulinum]OOO62188.1 hypothetical protein BS637_08700 [Clostridium tepidum]OOO67206.1 hypothetical protein BS638_05865 [Clostridium tepidum]
MGRIVKFEIKKMLLRLGVIIPWILVLMFSTILLNTSGNDIVEIYSSVFDKSYGIAPLIGLLTFTIVSGAYTKEYDNNIVGLINSTQNGKKNIVRAKSLAAGISTSIVNLSILLTIYLTALRKTDGKGLQLPLKSLWYFDNSGSNLKVYQMMIIMIVTVVIGSFIFAQIGLYLSSISKSAVIPFIFGGLIMGIPYLLEGFLIRAGNKGSFLSYTPLWGMYSCQIVRHKSSMGMALATLVVIFIIVMTVLSKATSKAFSK